MITRCGTCTRTLHVIETGTWLTFWSSNLYHWWSYGFLHAPVQSPKYHPKAFTQTFWANDKEESEIFIFIYLMITHRIQIVSFGCIQFSRFFIFRHGLQFSSLSLMDVNIRISSQMWRHIKTIQRKFNGRCQFCSLWTFDVLLPKALEMYNQNVGQRFDYR